jgi:hypothetical protein
VIVEILDEHVNTICLRDASSDILKIVACNVRRRGYDSRLCQSVKDWADTIPPCSGCEKLSFRCVLKMHSVTLNGLVLDIL